MKTLMYSMLIIMCNQYGIAQSNKLAVAMPSPGITAYGKNPADFSFHHNVSSLAGYEKREVSLFSERRFLLSELQFFSGAFTWKMGSGRMGVTLDHYGAGGFSRSGAGAAYARKLGRVSVGLKFNYETEQASGYSSASVFSAQSGMLVSLTPRLNFGWQVENFPAAVSAKAGKVATIYRGGVGFMASKDCVVGLEMIKQQYFPLNLHAGFCYTYRDRLFLKGGVQSATGSYYAGCGWTLRKIRLHVSVSHHPYLGISPGFLVSHKF